MTIMRRSCAVDSAEPPRATKEARLAQARIRAYRARAVTWRRQSFSARSADSEVAMRLQVSRVAFNGAILKRGFWLYLVEVVSSRGRRAMYVGRTGDTSSPHAASLFTRLTAHLNDRKSSKANSLLKRMIEQDLDCTDCSYRLVGIGPVFNQQANMDEHKPLRDQMAGLERAVADHLRERGYAVLGDHPKPRMVQAELLATVLNLVDEELSVLPNDQAQQTRPAQPAVLRR